MLARFKERFVKWAVDLAISPSRRASADAAFVRACTGMCVDMQGAFRWSKQCRKKKVDQKLRTQKATQETEEEDELAKYRAVPQVR